MLIRVTISYGAIISESGIQCLEYCVKNIRIVVDHGTLTVEFSVVQSGSNALVHYNTTHCLMDQPLPPTAPAAGPCSCTLVCNTSGVLICAKT